MPTISQFPQATLPLTTAEIIGLMQSGVTSQATIAALFLAMTTKITVNNNAASTYTVNPTTPSTLINFTGTNVASLTINFPAAAAAIDGYTICITSVAGVGTVTFASGGATFPSPTTALGANGRTAYTFQSSTNTWLRS